MSKEEILSYFYTNSTEYGVKRTLIILLRITESLTGRW